MMTENALDTFAKLVITCKETNWRRGFGRPGSYVDQFIRKSLISGAISLTFALDKFVLTTSDRVVEIYQFRTNDEHFQDTCRIYFCGNCRWLPGGNGGQNSQGQRKQFDSRAGRPFEELPFRGRARGQDRSPLRHRRRLHGRCFK